VTIPKRMALKGGFNDVDYVAVSQAGNGNIKIRRIYLDKEDGERIHRNQSGVDRQA